jgi:hypothetical protein
MPAMIQSVHGSLAYPSSSPDSEEETCLSRHFNNSQTFHLPNPARIDRMTSMPLCSHRSFGPKERPNSPSHLPAESANALLAQFHELELVSKNFLRSRRKELLLSAVSQAEGLGHRPVQIMAPIFVRSFVSNCFKCFAVKLRDRVRRMRRKAHQSFRVSNVGYSLGAVHRGISSFAMNLAVR